jgi:acyl-CoA dehydrogenase
MFIMMNAARFAVGLEGVGLSERAFQSARAFAHDRVQGTEPGERGRVAIVRHPDVRRMLMLMKSQTEAMRALAAVAAVSLDAARLHPSPEERTRHQAVADLLIPVVKGWCTETSVEVASLGVQVHGGMGFIEETGVAQHFRDSRITPIYEGTTAIQANDLVGRKIARDGGAAAKRVIADMRMLERGLRETPGLAAAAAVFSESVGALERSVEYVVSRYASDFKQVSVGAVPLLKLFGIVAGGWQLLRSAAIAGERLAGAGESLLPGTFYRAKIETAGFYAHHVLSQAPGLAHSIVHGAAAALAEGVL